MQTIQEVSKETKAIESFLADQKEGTELSYITIQVNSGVEMNERGKTFMRSALKRLKIPYETKIGHGIVLLGPANAMRIVVHKTVKIDGAVKKAEKTTKQVMKSASYEKVDIQSQQKIGLLAAMFGSIRNIANAQRQIYRNNTIKVGETISK